MTKLTDLQLVLLSTAAARSDGSLLPPAASVTTQAGRIRRAIAILVGRELAADLVVANQALSYRIDGDTLFGALITDAGRSAVGAEPALADLPALPDQVENDAASEEPPSDAQGAATTVVGDDAVGSPPSTPRSGSKSALVVELLGRDQGATIEELTAATGWLPHTTRAALTGLRKKGHAIARTSRDGTTCYNIAMAA